MKVLIELLSGRRDDVPLDVAALEIAAIEFPDLAPDRYLLMLDDHASAIAGRLPASPTGQEFVAAAGAYLFDEKGFEGNEADYYNPRNSCLNHVLETRTGIPITLSILNMEIARRLGQPVRGIGLPGHFLVQYEDATFSAYVDVFHGGEVLSLAQCRDLALRSSGVDIYQNTALLQPAGRRQIVIRMLNNLRNIYFRRQNHRKALSVLDLLIATSPASADEYRQRGVLRAELQQYRAAQGDFRTYLRLSPDAEDKQEVEQRLLDVTARLSSLN